MSIEEGPLASDPVVLTSAELLFLGSIVDPDRVDALGDLLGQPSDARRPEVMAASAPDSLVARGLLSREDGAEPQLDPRCSHLAALLGDRLDCIRVTIRYGESLEVARYLQDGRRRVVVRLRGDGLLEAHVLAPDVPLGKLIADGLATLGPTVGPWVAKLDHELTAGERAAGWIQVASDERREVTLHRDESSDGDDLLNGLISALKDRLVA